MSKCQQMHLKTYKRFNNYPFLFLKIKTKNTHFYIHSTLPISVDDYYLPLRKNKKNVEMVLRIHQLM